MSNDPLRVTRAATSKRPHRRARRRAHFFFLEDGFIFLGAVPLLGGARFFEGLAGAGLAAATALGTGAGAGGDGSASIGAGSAAAAAGDAASGAGAAGDGAARLDASESTSLLC